MLLIIIGIIFSYLLGSIPTAYIFGKVLKGVDIRQFGSGNVGATNALRLLGKGPGITVLILDIIKGFIPVFLFGNLILARINFIDNETLCLILGISCVCGHNWTVFLQFKGGKGIATTLGVLIGLSTVSPSLRLILGLLILTWITVFLIGRIVSLASVIGAAALPVYAIILRQTLVLIFFSVLLSAFVIYRHKANLKRILSGQEKRLF
ncbi:MAG: glycerol-3-phosphate 1-O-acyltransferase PlsY [Candidatus Omnitrophica bacterium]|nr:glycerol-3-phosphate 1-O-acyltransferase PlsY [Candidatus Omnitrophota bacterium]